MSRPTKHILLLTLAATAPPLAAASSPTAGTATHWALAPVSTPVPPADAGAWARNEIDQFIATALTVDGLAPSPEALEGSAPAALEEEDDALDEARSGADQHLGHPLALRRIRAAAALGGPRVAVHVAVKGLPAAVRDDDHLRAAGERGQRAGIAGRRGRRGRRGAGQRGVGRIFVA